MKNLKDKKVLITGAGSGMGRQLAYQLSALGAKVFITDINPQTLSETADAIKAKGGECRQYVLDSGNQQAIEEFAGTFLKEEQYLDVLINNAGMAIGEVHLTEVKDEHLRRVVDVNMWGVVHFTRAFLPSLLSRPEASLVNFSSVFGLAGVKTQIPYSITKFAVRGLSEGLRMELYNTNVTVTSIHPGGIATNIARNGIHYKDAEQSIARFDKMTRTSAEKAAAIIIDGIRKKKTKVLVGPDAYVIDWIVRLFPVRYTGIFLWMEKWLAPKN
jgi:NADP-dependent 3-hydroxy acid dehydrogenase YdfG